jgi:type IV pilus assembly protein PilM
MLGSDRILGLDIGASTVKVAEFQSSKAHGLRLLQINHAEIGSEPEQEETRSGLIVRTVRNALKERNIKSRRVVFSVSGQSVFTRFVRLPPVDESKVSQIIQYEAQQNVPFPIDEVVWDYQLIGNGAEGQLDVVLLAIKSNIIEELHEGVEAAGLSAEMVDVAPMALYNAVRYNYGDPEGCTVVLDIGARTTNLLFLEKGKIFARSIPIAGNAITQSIAAEFNIPFAEAERLKKSSGFVALGGAYEEPDDEKQARLGKIIRNVMTRLHAEVARSVNFYRGQQGGSAPARLLLSGGSSIIPYTDRFFREKIQVSVEYFNPFRNVEIDPGVARDELARCAHFFGEVVGLGLRRLTQCPIEVNLLPKSLKARQQAQQKRPYLVGAAICSLLIPLCWWLYANRLADAKEKTRAEIAAQVAKLKDLDRQLQAERQALAAIEQRANKLIGVVADRHAWNEVFQELSARLVEDVWYVSFSPQFDGGGEAPAPPVPPRAGRGRTPTGAPVAAPPPTPTGGREITTLIAHGRGKHQDPRRTLRLVDTLEQQLRESPLFDPDGTRIITQPRPLVDDPEFSFTMQIKLKKPIALPK